MKNLAILFLIATVLPSVWTRSLQVADDTLVEREDDLDITKLSEDELRPFVDESRESLKRGAEKLVDDDTKQPQTPHKRQLLWPTPRPMFSVPKFNFTPRPSGINLGKGFGIRNKALIFQRGNFGGFVQPEISFGKSGIKVGRWNIGLRFKFR